MTAGRGGVKTLPVLGHLIDETLVGRHNITIESIAARFSTMSIPCLIERFAGLVALRAAREEIISSSWKFPKAAGKGERDAI